MSISDSIATLRDQFDSRGGDEAPWLAPVRSEAFARFADRGFPTTRDEEWRFTNVAPIAAGAFGNAADAALDEPSRLRSGLGFGASAGLDCHELVFVNGRFAGELSSLGAVPEGVNLGSLMTAASAAPDKLEPILSRVPATSTPFFDLNNAMFTDGAFVRVPSGVALDWPVHLVFLATTGQPAAIHPRNLIIAESSSQLRVIETYAGAEGAVYWTNAVTEVIAREDAVVDHYKLQLESNEAFHVATMECSQARSSAISNHSLSLGGRLARHDINASLDGEGADVTLNGLYVVSGKQHVDHHTVIDHRVPHCTSRELYKGVLSGASKGVFNGRVIVRADAQKTDSRQSNKNLLLSDQALVQTNPQLEINADDVKCAHGATIGQLDDDMLFYLRSRGIGAVQARAILTEGFMADVSERIRIDALRDALTSRLFAQRAA